MGSKILVASIAVELCVVLVAASGCASGSQPRGFGGAPPPATGTQAMPLGTYPASASLSQKYGIAEWRTYVGKTQIVVTGYRADGTAARGMQLAWFPSTATSVGHTRLTMLDGTGAVLRRMVGSGETGHLSTEQTDLLQTMRYDLARAPRPAFTPLHGSSFGGGPGTVHVLDDSSGMPSGTSPNTGPQCMKAMTDPSIPIDAAGCGFGAATFETVMGGIVALGTCTQWYAETKAAQATCDTENSANCNGDTCNFGQNDSAAAPDADAAVRQRLRVRQLRRGRWSALQQDLRGQQRLRLRTGVPLGLVRTRAGQERQSHRSERLAARPRRALLRQRRRDGRSVERAGGVLEQRRIRWIVGGRKRKLVRHRPRRNRPDDGRKQQRRIGLGWLELRRLLRRRWGGLCAGLGLLPRCVQRGHVRNERWRRERFVERWQQQRQWQQLRWRLRSGRRRVLSGLRLLRRHVRHHERHVRGREWQQ